MTVFRGYLLIIKRNWGFIFIYTALFLFTMLIIQGETQKRKKRISKKPSEDCSCG